MHDLGSTPSPIYNSQKIVGDAPWVLMYDYECLSHAASNLSMELFISVVSQAPDLVLRNIVPLGSKLRFLLRHGLKVDDAVKLISRRPVLLAMDISLLEERINALAQLPGLKIERVLRRMPSILKQEPKTWQYNLKTLAQEMPNLDIMHIIDRQPSLLSSDAKTVLKVKHLLNDLFPEISAERIIYCAPAILTFKPESIEEKWRSIQHYCALDEKWNDEIEQWTTGAFTPSLAISLCYSPSRHKRFEQASRAGPARHSVMYILTMTELQFLLQFPGRI